MFDLTSAPLARFHLVFAPDGAELHLIAHHIALDGWGARLLLSDLATMYANDAAGLAVPSPDFGDSKGRLPLAQSTLCVSGRLSFELVQKAAVAGCPILVAVGAPSTLAVELAGDRRITLCGFVRGGRANVYTEPWRIEG